MKNKFEVGQHVSCRKYFTDDRFEGKVKVIQLQKTPKERFVYRIEGDPLDLWYGENMMRGQNNETDNRH